MKKIICLFLMATTLSLVSAPAMAQFKTGQTATMQLSDISLAEINGGGKHPHVECMAAAATLGFAIVAQQWYYVAMFGLSTYAMCFILLKLRNAIKKEIVSCSSSGGRDDLELQS
jgi:hypothetical protein